MMALRSSMLADQNDKWVRFSGDDAWPSFRDGDFIRLTYVGQSIDNEMIGRICLIANKNGQFMQIGIVENGLTSGNYDLKPFNSSRIRNVAPDSVFMVVEIRFQSDGAAIRRA